MKNYRYNFYNNAITVELKRSFDFGVLAIDKMILYVVSGPYWILIVLTVKYDIHYI